MNEQLKISMVGLALLLATFANAQETGSLFRLFYLGGQSNMDGFGKVSELPDSLNATFDRVYIFHGNPAVEQELDGGLGTWERLRPGHGRGFSSEV